MRSRRITDLLKFLNLLFFLILLNMISYRNFFRWDLTQEKRFSISKATKNILGELNDEVLVEVYLDGDLPPDFIRMRKSIEEILEEFRVYSNNNVKYKFIDPSSAVNAQSREKFFNSIAEKGIQPTDVFLNQNGSKIQKRILPGAVVSYGLGERGVMLFKGNSAAPPLVRLNQSIEGIEYELASAIETLYNDDPGTIALLAGNGEVDSLEIISLKSALAERYRIRSINLQEVEQITGADAIIMAKPSMPFTEAEKFKLDQYLMKGGKALFMVDMLNVNMDSLETGTFAFDRGLNLEDMFFKYGLRLNPDFIQDIISGATSIVVGNMGDQPQVQLMPWPFYPIINNFSDHLITRNLNAVIARFVGSIDTVKAVGINKTPLVFTSNYSRKLSSPVRVSVEDLKTKLQPGQMKDKNVPVGYLLEGHFTSLYKNRFPPPGISRSEIIIPESEQTQIIVLSDGDFGRNEINKRSGRPLELGYDQITQQSFGNLDFLLNSIDYLMDGEGLITARAKEIQMRPLDKVKIQEEKTKWQIVNILGPLAILLFFAVLKVYLRRRKYTNFG